MGFEAPQRLARALGEDDQWLRELPATVEETVARLDLTIDRVLAPGGRSGVVLLVRRADDTPAALKLAPPAAAPARERAALERWDGWGAVRVLPTPPGPTGAGDALLLERLRPEVSLRSLPEAKALLEAAGVVRKLWVAPEPGHGFETVAARTARQAAVLREYPDAPLVAEALEAWEGLTATGTEELLLHGCFRQGKVLAGERTPWLAVGPEPVVGERAHDLAGLVLDRLEDLVASSSGARAARRRVTKVADSLDVDADRLRGWVLFCAVVSATRAPSAGRDRRAEATLEFASWL
ncbi:aminoglycoside phosphotransferase family protein [Streptomyces sp. NPDC057638]|uniref:aminoglycoside phosphotransferase family protein n=1 Tax=Streptomyces sp. NPDC057638 TaxID=3346190 RepID=UPI003695A2E3